MPDESYQPDMPADVLEARTGIPAIDLAVRELYETGYLHNHARMWLASYLVHLRKVHWHAGAQWMLGHLLDGDVASNHLSWQWVAGTGSNKPYLFNAENVAKYAPAPWNSPGTAIDSSYEALDLIARKAGPVHDRSDLHRTDAGVQQPDLRTRPPGASWIAPDAAPAVGRNVLLVHPWTLGVVPLAQSADVVAIGVGFAESHINRPWSERRWRFVEEGLLAQTTQLWWGTASQVALRCGMRALLDGSLTRTPMKRWTGCKRYRTSGVGNLRRCSHLKLPYLKRSKRTAPAFPSGGDKPESQCDRHLPGDFFS